MQPGTHVLTCVPTWGRPSPPAVKPAGAALEMSCMGGQTGAPALRWVAHLKKDLKGFYKIWKITVLNFTNIFVGLMLIHFVT